MFDKKNVERFFSFPKTSGKKNLSADSEKNTNKKKLFLPKTFSFKQTQEFYTKQGIPVNTNYATLSTIIGPTYQEQDFILPLIDLRGIRFNNGSLSLNTGLLFRFPLGEKSSCSFLGCNTFYRYRQTDNGHYQQLSFGGEFLSKTWEIRAQGYVPLRNKINKFGVLFDDYDGNYYAHFRFIEEAPYAASAELGYYFIHKRNMLLYCSIGSYYLAKTESFPNIIGYTFNIRPQITDYVSLDVSYRYDNIFRSLWQSEISIQIPLYNLGKKSRERCSMVDYQIYQNARLLEVIPLTQLAFWETNY